MAIEVFNRYEKKYMLDEHTFRRLLERINDYVEPDKYNLNGQFYSICNIYYDTDDNRLIRSSIEKPVYKEKLRMRSYGTPCGEDKVFLEIKKKYNGIVNTNQIWIYNMAVNMDAVNETVKKGTAFYVKLIDVNGNAISGGQVSFKINGVSYIRSVNETGYAKLNINLRPGTYILTAYNPLNNKK